MLAYEVIYRGECFNSFERRVANAIACGIDLGNINHSKEFLMNFLKATFEILLSEIRKTLHAAVPFHAPEKDHCCTSNLIHRGHIQSGILVRHISIVNGNLFREVHADDVRSDGKSLTDSMLKTFRYGGRRRYG